MAKQQQFIDLFAKYDQDKDGEINQEEFIKIITELEVPYQYPGTVTKIIRKLNCANPDKNTLNLQQAKEYYNSFQSISKHQIWKAKIGLLNKVQELKVAFDEPKEESGAAPTAAPGAVSSVEESEKKPQEARINILIGNNQPVYLSEIEGYVEKSETNQKVKPFVKLTFTSKTEQRAKQLEIIGKQNVNSLFSILSEEEPDYADLFKEIHVNSMVNQTKTIFFITTANEEVLQYIQLLGQFFDLSFSTQLIGKFHLRYEFDYDFQKFINEENSNFYDIFTKNCRLSINLKLLNLLKSLKKYLKLQAKENPYMDIVESMLITSLFHIQQIEGDFQFQNSQSTEYDLESKQQLKEFITEWGVIFDKLTNSGMKIREMLQLLDDTITIQFNGGQWKANVFLRLKNLEKVILQLAKPQEQQQQQPNEPAQLPDSPHVLQKSGSGSSLGSVNSIKKPKAPKPSQAHQQSPELSEESDD